MSQESVKAARAHAPARAVFEQVILATNRHDLEALVACFASDYRSEQPFHPELNFTGPAGVRRNWSYFFTTMPDIRVEILNAAEEGDVLFLELDYHGTQANGNEYTMRGVMVCGTAGEQIGWARLYINPQKVPD
jgi:ketosteroid isomerase-like protein